MGVEAGKGCLSRILGRHKGLNSSNSSNRQADGEAPSQAGGPVQERTLNPKETRNPTRKLRKQLEAEVKKTYQSKRTALKSPFRLPLRVRLHMSRGREGRRYRL